MSTRVVWAWILGIALMLPAATSEAAFEYSVFNSTGGGSFVLNPGPSQTVQIFLNSTALDPIGSLQFRIRIGDGVGVGLEPPITSVTPGPTFAAYTPGFAQPTFAPGNSEMIYDLSALATPAVTFTGNVLAATLTLNTAPFEGQGPFAFSFTNSIGTSSVLSPGGVAYNTTLSNGSFTVAAVPEPSSMALLCIATAGAGAVSRFRKKRKLATV